MIKSDPRLKYKIDWNQSIGTIRKLDSFIILHPIDLISRVQKAKGLDEACALAHRLITKKYHQLLEDSKIKERTKSRIEKPIWPVISYALTTEDAEKSEKILDCW